MTATASLETRTAWINESRYEGLSKEIARINRRAARLSVPGYTLTRKNVRVIQVSISDPNGDSRTIPVRQVEVEVVGQPVCLSGWTFAATIQHLGDGADNILRVSPAFHEASIPTQYRTASSSVCDHCCTARFRRETYILQSSKGEWKQVGSTCIADFLGSDATHAVARAEMAFSIGIALGDAGRDHSRSDLAVSTQNFLACAIACVRAHGWVSRKEAREGHAQATADLALNVMRGRGPKGSRSVKTSDDDYQTALQVMEWGRSLAERDGLNDYLWNLRAAFAGDYMPSRAEGIIASGYIAFLREKESERRAREAADSKHIGEVGQRLPLALKATAVRSMPSNYGVTTLVSFVTREGDVVKWFASGDKTAAFKPGKTYQGDVTIRKHDEWQGVKQTIVSHCFLAVIA